MKKVFSLKERTNGNPIHSRSLDLKAYPLDEDRIIVEGWPRDERFKTIYNTPAHGYWANKRGSSRSIPHSLEEIEGLSYVINSCLLWREDGPLVHELRELIETQKGS